MHPIRTHTCGELRAQHIGQTVRLAGWMHRKRDFGGVLFIVLRDHYGLTQVTINKDSSLFTIAAQLKPESIVIVTGEVVSRGEQVNPEMPTGEIEVQAQELVVESPAQQLPFMVAVEEEIPEELRLRYRFLDLRRARMQRNILLRARLCQHIRNYLTARGFHEIHTPILTSSSPEGARDFLVPSRLYPGQFYALPQAPQQFKQLLMIAGFDRYFQIAPCFRDEDARADRSPGEFYQLDLEMSFCTQEDVFEVVEGLMIDIFQQLSNKTITTIPFPRIPYQEALERFGTDKPDLRFGCEMVDVSSVFVDTDFKIFAQVLAQQGQIRALRLEQGATQPRRFFDEADAYAKEQGCGGLLWLSWKPGAAPKGRLARFVQPEQLAKLQELTGLQPGDALLVAADAPAQVQKVLGKVRLWLAQRLGWCDSSKAAFCWITDFPMYEWNAEEERYEFSHNPFSMPQGGMAALENQDPLKILAYQYDIVCNGVELSSGAIRNHRPDIMLKAFAIAGYDHQTVESKFPALWQAFHYGAPPHGGIAPGLDRIAMLLCDEINIREVIAFPLNQQAQDLLMGAPSPVAAEQLAEVHIQIKPPAADQSSQQNPQ